MDGSDPLFRLLCDFFDLPRDTRPEEISQEAVESWDSLAMVQLIADLQGTFGVEFELDEIGALRSYNEIRSALQRKASSRSPLG
jgi:acyl carrier protein